LRRARRGLEGAGKGVLLASSRSTCGAQTMIILYVVVALAAAALALNALNRRKTDDLRQTGLLPPPGRGSAADVERLVALGRKIAIASSAFCPRVHCATRRSSSAA